MRILVTGGSGFIGSHTCIALLEKKHEIVVLDSHANSNMNIIPKIRDLFKKKYKNIEVNLTEIIGDIRDENLLNNIFLRAQREGNSFDAVFHFAGLKSIKDSLEYPIEYWDTNLSGTVSLIKYMEKYNCKTLVFSSSASIYGLSDNKLLKESSPINPNNPYAMTKASIEKVLNDVFNSSPKEWKIANLRYFNPIGAHPSAIIGESPIGLPNNIFPLILEVAKNQDRFISIYGNDWSTKDGTGVRDYIHVMDLAEGHLAALDYLKTNDSQIISINLGTGLGTSVLELIKEFEKVNKVKIPYKFAERRSGDTASLIADNSLAINLLDWLPKRSLREMCVHGWSWYQKDIFNFDG